jgi:hypothetical protein
VGCVCVCVCVWVGGLGCYGRSCPISRVRRRSGMEAKGRHGPAQSRTTRCTQPPNTHEPLTTSVSSSIWKSSSRSSSVDALRFDMVEGLLPSPKLCVVSAWLLRFGLGGWRWSSSDSVVRKGGGGTRAMRGSTPRSTFEATYDPTTRSRAGGGGPGSLERKRTKQSPSLLLLILHLSARATRPGEGKEKLKKNKSSLPLPPPSHGCALAPASCLEKYSSVPVVYATTVTDSRTCG